MRLFWVFLAVGIASITFVEVAFGEDNKELSSLTGVEVDYDQKETLITLKFSKGLKKQAFDIKDHSTFINIDIDQSVVKDPGTFFEGKGPYLSKVALFQFSDSSSAVRLFVHEKASDIKKALVTNLLNDRLILAINHEKLSELGYKNHLPKESFPKAKEILESTKVRADIPDPAAMVKGDPSEPGKAEVLTEERLMVVAGFSAIMIGVFLLFHFGRQKLRVNLRSRQESSEFPIRALSTYNLAPKKNLTVLEVGGQKILLGVSSDQINYLTTLEDKTEKKKASVSQSFSELVQSPPPKPNRAQVKKSTPKAPQKALPANPLKPVAQKPPLQKMARNDALEDVTSLIRKKLKNLPQI